jgi:hypothetical protein
VISYQGDQMRKWKNRPNWSPTRFFVKIYAQLLPWKKVACTYERFKITTHSKQ